MATLNGIDISSWQTGIDLSAVPADFVIVKATEATTYVNPDCDRALQQALRAGKLLGVYHFARPGDARAQADFFIAQCKEHIGRAVLVLDWEANALPLGPSWAKAWLDRVHQVTGIRPLIYMSASVTGQYDWSQVVASNYGLWVAAYAWGYQRIDGYRVPSGPTGVKHWPTVAIWQYTSSGRLSEWGGKLDLNIFYGDSAAWGRYAGSSGAAPTTATAKPAPAPAASPAADGYWGSTTTRALQRVLGTPQDGVVSSQSAAWRSANTGLTSGWEWATRPTGSTVIRALQKKIGVPADGLIGPTTIRALQKRVGTPADGVLSAESKAIAALQRRLQKGTI